MWTLSFIYFYGALACWTLTPLFLSTWTTLVRYGSRASQVEYLLRSLEIWPILVMFSWWKFMPSAFFVIPVILWIYRVHYLFRFPNSKLSFLFILVYS